MDLTYLICDPSVIDDRKIVKKKVTVEKRNKNIIPSTTAHKIRRSNSCFWQMKNEMDFGTSKTRLMFWRKLLYTKVVKKQFGLRKMMRKSCFFGKK